MGGRVRGRAAAFLLSRTRDVGLTRKSVSLSQSWTGKFVRSFSPRTRSTKRVSGSVREDCTSPFVQLGLTHTHRLTRPVRLRCAAHLRTRPAAVTQKKTTKCAHWPWWAGGSWAVWMVGGQGLGIVCGTTARCARVAYTCLWQQCTLSSAERPGSLAENHECLRDCLPLRR